MKNIFALIACAVLFSQCRPHVDVQPTGSYDTLGVKWMTIERDNIIYYFQGTGVKGASIYTDLHEEAYAKLEPIFNPQLPQKLRYFVWTDWEVAKKIFDPPEWAAGFALPKQCVCNVQADISLGHELTHIFSYWADGIEPTSYSRFINEGIAVAFDLELYDKLEEAKEAIKGYNIQSITEIWDDTQEATPPDILYPVSGAFVDYLYKQNMHDEFFMLIKYQTREDAEYIYGKDKLDALVKEFDNLLGL